MDCCDLSDNRQPKIRCLLNIIKVKPRFTVGFGGMETSAVNRGFACLHSTICIVSPIWGKKLAAVNRGAVNQGFTVYYIFSSRNPLKVLEGF